MKTFISILIFISHISIAQVEEELIKPWVVADKPLDEIAKTNPGKDILVFYTADWCLTSAVMKKRLITDEFTQIMSKKNLLIVMVDCTQEDSIGSRELKLGGSHTESIPAISMIHRDGMVTYAKFDSKNLKTMIASIIRKTEQDIRH